MRTMHIVTILPAVVTVWLMGCTPSLPVMDRIDPFTQETALSHQLPRLKVIEPPFLPPFSPEIVFHGPRDAKLIALTFDACATRALSHYDERITQVLVDKKVPATLFLGGKWIEENQHHARYLASLPQFELGNHSFLHPHLTQVSDARLREELASTQAALYTVTGRHATVFRAPYGEYDRRTVRFAAEMGLTTIQYDLASGDPDVNITKNGLFTYVIERARPGSIVVMHINRRGWRTAEALPEIVDALRQKGFTFVTVGELLTRINTAKAGAEVNDRGLKGILKAGG